MAMLSAIAGWIGRVLAPLLASVLPELIEQWKKPRQVQVHGGDSEARDDIARHIEEDSLRSIGGTRIGPVPGSMADVSDRPVQHTQEQAPGADRSGRAGA